jgi:hypothetical protein
MQSHTSRIWQRNARIRVKVALRRQDSNQRRIQTLADPSPPEIGAHVDGCVDGPLISGTRPVPGCIRITGDAAFVLTNQPGIGRQRFHDTPLDFVLVRRLRFEGDRSGLDNRPVDFRDASGVISRSQPNIRSHELIPLRQKVNIRCELLVHFLMFIKATCLGRRFSVP